MTFQFATSQNCDGQMFRSYTIVRVSGFNEDPSGEVSTIDLKAVSSRRNQRKFSPVSNYSISKSNQQMSPVSRAEVAQICVGALLDSNALNKSVYMSKKRTSAIDDEDISRKFAAVKSDTL